MPEPKKEEIAPLFEAYGAACYEAQHLEGALKLLLIIIAEKQQARSASKSDSVIGSAETNKTLGDLFKDARNKEYFTSAEQKTINRAIKERNFLIHSYWNKRIQYSLTPKGRSWLVQNMTELRDLMRTATTIVNSLIDKYLEQYGVSVEYFASKTEEVWESDLEPPPGLLH